MAATAVNQQGKNESTIDGSICISKDHLCDDASLRVKVPGPSAEDYALKVRKPYTISKQREKWTEEEHNKFLEALKLYGRAWRRIEEHIGTKTSVQIRSHAQKFFTKVARESANNVSNLKAIEIPPPRPKRKPTHPYPRKLTASPIKDNYGLEQPQLPSSPSESASHQDNQSPTSVLSPFVSDTGKIPIWGRSKSCASPTSSTSGSTQVGTSHDLDLDIGLQSPTALILSSAGLSTQGRSMKGSDRLPEGDLSRKCSQESTCLKLFGRTVVVSNTTRNAGSQGSDECQYDSVPDSIASSDEVSPCTRGITRFVFCLPVNTTGDSSGKATVPFLWPCYQSGALAATDPQQSVSKREAHLCTESLKVEQQNKLLSDGSINISSDQITSQNFSKFQRSKNSAFRTLGGSNGRPTRSVLPHKRCFDDREHNAVMITGDVESKRVELCL